MSIQSLEKIPPKRKLIVVAIMASTLMQVLDSTIVNVALPHMQGSLEAAPDQISWTLTCYLIASAIFMPLTGYFTDRLGRKNYLLLCIGGFTVASMLCGTAQTLTEMILFRLLQGIFGAAIVPLSQAILTDIYSKEELGKAMAIWGMGVMVGPIIGPTLGGYITEIASWRWIFYINVPVGIMSFLLAAQVVPQTIKTARKMDWLGFFLLTVGIAAMQLTLDRGNREDWFGSNMIVLTTIISVLGISGFIIYGLRTKNRCILNLAVFKDKNFTLATILSSMISPGLFGSIVLLPLLLENLLNYPVVTTGLIMSPRGFFSMIGMILVGRLMKSVEPRWLTISGLLIAALGTSLCQHYTINIDPWHIFFPLAIQGLGLGLLFVPMSAMAYTTLSPALRSEAAGIFSLLRTIGSSFGIAIILTLFSRHTQMAWNHLGGFIQPYNPALLQYSQQLHLQPQSPQAVAIISSEIAKQAQMISFNHMFSFITWSFLILIPGVFFLKRISNR